MCSFHVRSFLWPLILGFFGKAGSGHPSLNVLQHCAARRISALSVLTFDRPGEQRHLFRTLEDCHDDAPRSLNYRRAVSSGPSTCDELASSHNGALSEARRKRCWIMPTFCPSVSGRQCLKDVSLQCAAESAHSCGLQQNMVHSCTVAYCFILAGCAIWTNHQKGQGASPVNVGRAGCTTGRPLLPYDLGCFLLPECTGAEVWDFGRLYHFMDTPFAAVAAFEGGQMPKDVAGGAAHHP